ncbi:MAG: glycerate dehydrogenase [Deltaproteobacteria bacterium]|nr:glycerate dehydrogenase [Deltaproteobacteria bacterium]
MITMKKPQIAFLDEPTVHLKDLNFSAIQKIGEYIGLKSCPTGKIPRSVQNAEVVISNKVLLGDNEFSQLKNLRLICVAATGVNNIDLEAAKQRGIAVCNVAGYSTVSVLEHTLMFLLNLSHRFLEHQHSAVSGEWSRSSNFAVLSYPFQNLSGKTLCVIGYGSIGKRVAKFARALGMEVLVAKIPGRKYGISDKRVALKSAMQKADYVSLHCPLTPLTQDLINEEKLLWMKPSAYLLNLARGPIVVEKDIVQALKKEVVAGYASDVAAEEPLPKNHPFLQKSLKNKILLTPHVAWASLESRQSMIDEIAKNIQAFLKGKKRNRIV